MKNRIVIERHSAPSKLDESDYGTVCIIKKTYDKDIYLQTSHNSSHPEWELLGSFSELCPDKTIQELIDDRLR